jgi:hypothetical protein
VLSPDMSLFFSSVSLVVLWFFSFSV